MNNFPLLDLFIQLRTAGLSIGISEYELVLTALQRGLGTSDYTALARLCRTLWVKSPDELQIFNYYFDKFLEQERNLQDTKSEENIGEQENTPKKIFSSRIRLIIVGTIFILGATVVWWSVSRPKLPVEKLPEGTSIRKLPEPTPSPAQPETTNIPSPSESPQQVIPVEPVLTEFNVDYWWGLVLTGILFTGCWLVLGGKNKEKTKDDNVSQNLTDSDPQSTAISELIRDIEDEIQVSQIFLGEELSSNTDFIPITRRQMKQSWRYLRYSVREGPPVELDIDETIEQAARQGSLLNLVLMPRYVNQTELLLLIDQEGSMIPFHSLSQRLAETASLEGRLGNAGIYYFHNCPDGYIYRDPNHLEAQPISNVLARLHPTRAAVLIVSDAGASRGGLNPERIQLTKKFLSQVRAKVRQVAWLNPMPSNRWSDTTAQSVARFVPMFEMNRKGLDLAIDVLRGRSSMLK